MKLSKSFLCDYVDVEDKNIKEIADEMTNVGNEYESIGKISTATNVVVGYVRECEMHPDSDHLHVCQVEIKKDEVVQIVCGAPNVSKGQKVLVSLPGAVLPGNFEIKKGVIRGVESNGMICSLSELGLESKYQSEEDKSGIHVLDEDAPIGEDGIKYLGFDDEFIDFELTANRSDLHSVLGMAYEVGAIYSKKVKDVDMSYNATKEKIESYVDISVETDNCPLYLACMVKDVEIKESPKFIKTRLISSGIRPINNVVDISNYVMLELGQPLHFFDYKTLGDKIIVRMAENNEEVVTLDGQTRILNENDIVIANKKEAVGLAGVMGGLNSEVENTTKDIVIESAIFNPINIRNTANKILRSEASMRFEKGLDPKRTYMAIKRACHLLEKYANGKVISGMMVHDKAKQEETQIKITLEKINKVLGMNLVVSDVSNVWDRLDFPYTVKGEEFSVLVPSRRLDIKIKEDLIEEVGRIHGIKDLVSKLPAFESENGGYEKDYYKQKLLKERLSGLGLNEVRTYSLTSLKDINTYNSLEKDAITLQLPMSEERKYLRTSLIPSLIEVANYNTSRKAKDVFVYEISNVYFKEEDEFKEKTLVSGLLFGEYLGNDWQHKKETVDFYLLKGVIENILEYMGFQNRYTFDTNSLPLEFHPYQAARVLIDRKEVGYFGRIHPNQNKNAYFVFELDFNKLFDVKVRPIKNKEVSKYPSIVKDFAFLLDRDVLAADVVETIKKACGRMLQDVKIFDYYVGENIDNTKKSLAFKLTFMDMTKTLSDEEVMVLFHKAIEMVEKKHQGVLRDK